MKMCKEEAGKEGTQAGGETKSDPEEEDCKMSAKRRGKEGRNIGTSVIELRSRRRSLGEEERENMVLVILLTSG